jgi:transcription antitermination factor NusG
MESWYIAKSKPQKEGSLQSFLTQWGIEVYYPKVLEAGKKGVQKPLFPTYLFCRLDPDSRVWPIARWAPGMAYFLNIEGEPTRIPEGVVDYLKSRVGQWNDQGSNRHLKAGDKVMVLRGPFAGLEGIFQRYVPSRERCRILLEAVGNLADVELPEWEVQELESQEMYHLGVA